MRNPVSQYNSYLGKAIKEATRLGYKIRSIAIVEAGFNKNKLHYGLYEAPLPDDSTLVISVSNGVAQFDKISWESK